MPPRSFDRLLELVGPRIIKANTKFRKGIPPDHHLALAVRFLPAGETIRTSSFNFLAGRSTTCKIISEVCEAIWEVVGPVYVKCPSSAAEWLKVANEFEEKWNLPHCIGAIDGKHVVIECPAKSGTLNMNYESSFSKSLLAISDASYRFLYNEIGHFGSESDGGVFARSKFKELILAKQIGIPEASEIGSIGKMPYYFVGDEAFPLKTFMTRPYSRKSKLQQSFYAICAVCSCSGTLLFCNCLYIKFILYIVTALQPLFADTSDASGQGMRQQLPHWRDR
nr:uncharacterized protein LOC126530249 [Dermacentor andersoni]